MIQFVVESEVQRGNPFRDKCEEDVPLSLSFV